MIVALLGGGREGISIIHKWNQGVVLKGWISWFCGVKTERRLLWCEVFSLCQNEGERKWGNTCPKHNPLFSENTNSIPVAKLSHTYRIIVCNICIVQNIKLWLCCLIYSTPFWLLKNSNTHMVWLTLDRLHAHSPHSFYGCTQLTSHLLVLWMDTRSVCDH